MNVLPQLQHALLHVDVTNKPVVIAIDIDLASLVVVVVVAGYAVGVAANGFPDVLQGFILVG